VTITGGSGGDGATSGGVGGTAQITSTRSTAAP
jgi:hypothetical protein